MDSKEKKPLPEPRTYTVEQIAAILNIGRTTAYQLVKEEQFRIVRTLYRFYLSNHSWQTGSCGQAKCHTASWHRQKYSRTSRS